MSVLDNPEEFFFDVSGSASAIFPKRDDGEIWGNIGDKAIDQLMTSGGMRIGCWDPMSNQNIRSIPVVVSGISTGKSEALLVEFSEGDEVSGSVTVKSLAFVPIQHVQRYILKDKNWPTEDCPLL